MGFKKVRCCGWSKKAPYFVFHPKVVFYNFLPYFSGGVDSRLGSFFWHQYGSSWTLYYAAADKNHRSVLCHKISSFDTATMQERFGRDNVPDNSKFGGQILGNRKCDRCPQSPQWSTLFLPKSLLYYRCVRRTDFVAKYA